MFNYLAYLHGGLCEPGVSPAADGVALAEQCLEKLAATDNPEQFPPRLLILLTSPAYSDEAGLREMLSSIRQTFAAYKKRTKYLQLPEAPDVPLVGSSVAAVIFDKRIHQRGALLVCLASRLVEAAVAASLDVRADDAEAVPQLLKQLKLNTPSAEGVAQKPVTDPFLLTFFPALGAQNDEQPYLAPDLHRQLRQQAFTRIPIVGGVAASPGFQFANQEVLRSALVVARVFTGVPYASSIGHGLTETDTYLRVKTHSGDRRIVHSFDQEGFPAELLKLRENDDFALLGELSLNREPLVTMARLGPNGRDVRMLREVSQNDLFKVLEGNSTDMRRKAAEIFRDALRRQTLERPVGCLTFHCAARLDARLDFAGLITDAEKVMVGLGPYLGGFFDGEAGIDENGRYLFGNWCVSTLCLSDETRDRTLAHTGFKAISDATQPITSVASLADALEHSLKVIFDTGFPGAMISLVMQNNSDTWLVAKHAIGSRFTKILTQTQRPLEKGDILAWVVKHRKPAFIPDACADARCDQIAARASGIISHYVLPLFDRNDKPIAVLQFDLGDLRRRGAGLYEAEQNILQSLGTVVGATVLRVLNREVADRALQLDEALKEGLRLDNRDEALSFFIERAAKHFEVGMWHIRLPEAGDLVMTAGRGAFFEALRSLRGRISQEGASPTVRAFKTNTATVVNLAQDDEWHRQLLASCCNEPAANAVCEQTNSYANVPIRNSDGQPIGTVSLLSFEQWFFTRSRVRTLDALSQRLGYLLEHFQRKEKEKDYRERKFLLDIGSDFARTADFSRPYEAINEAVKRLRRAANAEIASLFLWDHEAERLVLRAQDGWVEPEWVDAARYQLGEPWTGHVAQTNEPQYVRDMYAYKVKHQMTPKRGYASKVFGRELGADFSVEAIGLPLRTSEKGLLGVVTLFRRIGHGQTNQGTGFTTIDPVILQDAADTTSAMLQLLLGKLRMDWFQREVRNHKAVRDALERGDPRISLETRLCRQFIKSFSVTRADLYLGHEAARLRLMASAQQPEAVTLTPETALIKKAALRREIQEQHHPVSGDQWRDLRSAKTEGLIERVCLPLQHGEHLLGVLDFYCRVERKKSPLLAVHDKEQLHELAAEIALMLVQQRELELNAKRQLTVQAMGAMVFSSAHRLMNLVQSIRSQSLLIKLAASDAEQQENLAELLRIIGAATEHIERPMEVARQMREIKPQPSRLRELVIQVMRELDFKLISPKYQLRLEVADNTLVVADKELLHEAFRNIIHNAIKAMPNGGKLVIAESPGPEPGQVQVSFEDTGVGMSEEQQSAALNGFVVRQDSIGMGVHVSLLLVRALNGDLQIESQEGVGTKVTIALPTERKELL